MEIYLFFAELFDNYMQQDAHEFLNYLLNTIADLLQGKPVWFCMFIVQLKLYNSLMHSQS